FVIDVQALQETLLRLRGITIHPAKTFSRDAKPAIIACGNGHFLEAGLNAVQVDVHLGSCRLVGVGWRLLIVLLLILGLRLVGMQFVGWFEWRTQALLQGQSVNLDAAIEKRVWLA